jgi:hypothetical protein
MTLLQAEEGFCALKSTLGLRPNYHQLEGRVDGHIFISVLAYHLLTWVREKLRDQGDLRDWKTLRRLLSTHMLATTLLTLEDERVLHLRNLIPRISFRQQAAEIHTHPQSFKSLGLQRQLAWQRQGSRIRQPCGVITENQSSAIVLQHANAPPIQMNDQGIHGASISSFKPKTRTISKALPSWHVGFPFSRSMMNRRPVPEVIA